MGLWLVLGDSMDELLTGPYTWLPFTEPLISWLLLMAYPAPTNCSPAFAETAMVGGFATGEGAGKRKTRVPFSHVKPLNPCSAYPISVVSGVGRRPVARNLTSTFNSHAGRVCGGPSARLSLPPTLGLNPCRALLALP